jgi:hypothetical protein
LGTYRSELPQQRVRAAHENPAVTVKCVEYGCEENAYYLIVYGCFELHIRELILCFHHGEQWASHQHHQEINCAQCRQPVEEYEFKWMDQLKGIVWS